MAKEELVNPFEGIDFGTLIEIDEPIISSTEEETDIPSVEELFEQQTKETEKTPILDLNKEEEEEEVIEESKEDEKETKETSSSILTKNATLLAKAFVEDGVFSEFDEEEFNKFIEDNGGTSEAEAQALINLIKNEVEANAEAKLQAYKDSLDPEKRSEVEAKELGINPQVLQQAENDVKILSGLDTDELTEDEAEKILSYYLQLTTKFDDTKIQKQIKKSKDLEDLIDEAKEAIPEIINIRKNDITSLKEEAKLAKEKAIEAENNRITKIKETISSTTEILGKKINKQTQTKIQDMLLKPAKEINGKPVNAVWAKRSEDPEKFDTILAGLMLSGAFDGKLDISTKPKTKAFNDLVDNIKTTKQIQSSSSGFNKEAMNILDRMKNME